MTITLYNYIHSELQKKGFNEIVDEQDNLVFFDQEHQFMPKIFSYDEDISSIVDQLFTGYSLDHPEHDEHFKKAFLFRFMNRQINRQTIEAFRMQLLSTFMMNKGYINRVYTDLELYLTQVSTNDQSTQSANNESNQQTNVHNNRQTNQQTNRQTNDGNTTTDNREAEATLPQNNVQLDVDSTIMTSANSNRISRNKALNQQTTDAETVGSNDMESDTLTSGSASGEATTDTFGETKGYRLDELFKTKGLHEQIYNVFDEKCFMQIW